MPMTDPIPPNEPIQAVDMPLVPHEQAVPPTKGTPQSATESPTVTIQNAREALEDIAKGDIQPEPAPEQPSNQQEKSEGQGELQQEATQESPLSNTEPPKPTDDTAVRPQTPETDQAATERAQKVDELLSKLGPELLALDDPQTLLVALSKSCGNTPLASQFRESVLAHIAQMPLSNLTNEQIERIAPFLREAVNMPGAEQPFIQSPMAAFLRSHGYPEDMIVQIGEGKTAIGESELFAQFLNVKDAAGNPTGIATDISKDLGLTKFPETADDMVRALGIGIPTGEQLDNMKHILQKELSDAGRDAWKKKLNERIKGTIVPSVSLGFILMMMMSSIASETDKSGAQASGGH